MKKYIVVALIALGVIAVIIPPIINPRLEKFIETTEKKSEVLQNVSDELQTILFTMELFMLVDDYYYQQTLTPKTQHIPFEKDVTVQEKLKELLTKTELKNQGKQPEYRVFVTEQRGTVVKVKNGGGELVYCLDTVGGEEEKYGNGPVTLPVEEFEKPDGCF